MSWIQTSQVGFSCVLHGFVKNEDPLVLEPVKIPGGSGVQRFKTAIGSFPR